MTTTTHNEAAERLLDHLRLNRAFEARDLTGMRNRLAAVQAEERRATVERIRAKALALRQKWGDPGIGLPASLQKILDEEAQ